MVNSRHRHSARLVVGRSRNITESTASGGRGCATGDADTVRFCTFAIGATFCPPCFLSDSIDRRGRRRRPTWYQRDRISVCEVFMKHLMFVIMAALILIGCGAGHANLTSITVSPQSATTTSSPQGQVGYTATGNFQNGKSRELSQVDGLSWKTSTTSTGTVAATIGSTGEVTCSAPGTVTITASAPQNLQFTVNNGVQNTSATVSGTAMLTCQ
jgi:hypothetical protein